MPTTLITDTKALAHALTGLRGRWLGLDTEFVRRRSYYPQLGLIQIADQDQVLLVDPLTVQDLQPLAALLADPTRHWVMHAAGEDQVALRTCQVEMPQPLVDTQIAAQFLGISPAPGYQRLAAIELGIEIDKSEVLSDWLARPLRTEQLRYASADAEHLPVLGERMYDRLVAANRHRWLVDEQQRRYGPAPSADEQAREDLRHFRTAALLSGPAQQRLYTVLRWRETHAREADLPKTWVLENGAAWALAERPPRSASHLIERCRSASRAATSALHGLYGQLDAVTSTEPLLVAAPDLADIREATAQRASELGLAADFLASRRLLEAHYGDPKHSPLKDGWRAEALAGIAGI